MTAWRIAVDRGGTFTDVVAHREGEVRHAKVLSAGEDSILDGIREVLGLDAQTPIPAEELEDVRIGTTVATNALLTRTGARTALVMTAGLGDLPRIGDQSRPELFSLDIRRPDPVATLIIEAIERLDVHGKVLQPLDVVQLRRDLEQARAQGCTAIAIALMHGWKYDLHERAVEEIATSLGFEEVVTSGISPLRGLIRRSDTVSVDAMLTPILRESMQRTLTALEGVPVSCMQSSGGLASAAQFRASRAVLSGPAGGLLGAAAEAGEQGIDQVVAFDMGGTSTDVSWYGGAFERETDAMLGGVRIGVPMLRVHTVAAGGGSICDVSGGRLRVGPHSAGAVPGPASYGRGGPATLTDCQILLGRLPAAHLPHVFGCNGAQSLDPIAAEDSLVPLSEAADLDLYPLAEGMLDVAVESIAAAIREISIERGRDVRDAALCAFGGAGGQMACRVADRLGMDSIIVPVRAGVLSAQGIAHASESAVRRMTVEQSVDTSESLNGLIDRLVSEASDALGGGGQCTRRVSAAIRAEGWDQSIQIPWDTAAGMKASFTSACQNRFGFVPRGNLVIASLEVEVQHPQPMRTHAKVEEVMGEVSTSRMYSGGHWTDVPVMRGIVGSVNGPVILLQEGATTVVEAGWKAESDPVSGRVMLCRATPRMRRPFQADNPADIEIANRRFLSICREMGSVLQHTAVSVNVKERRDYSCAIFDEEGRLVANGPHMPVHLGSMGESVQRVLAVHRATLKPGDAFLDNDPSHGGTHLPDLTVVSPVFGKNGLQYLVASRAHHADVGGTTPGSMPADSTCLDEEGVVFDAVELLRGGEFQEEDVRKRFVSARWPARQVDLNIEDLRAQLAANARGMALLGELEGIYGECLDLPMQAIRQNAACCVRSALRKTKLGKASIEMDGGHRLCVHVQAKGDGIVIDFAGTSAQVQSNLNAPRAVVRAAVLYVLRCLVADEIPLNDGCLEAVEIRIPDGTMLSPAPGAAVVGGNVETSQAVVDGLLSAFGLLAGSQGTMNNLTFGDGTRQYYETICGGAGAGEGFEGADAVHTHMTNSLLTDPEVLEGRYPIRLESFGLRKGSGGKGRWRGGDGVIRAVRFLEPMHVSLLSGRRVVPPRGMRGGGDGLGGRQRIERADGSLEEIPAQARCDLKAGDLFVIETPGGGGVGKQSSEE